VTDSIASYLTEDHRRCDHLLSACEAAFAAGAWGAADSTTADLRDAMLRHFSLEEDLLFPEVERASPAAAAPTRIMRMEHRQMCQLVDDLQAAVRARDRDTCLGNLETLHLVSQQHNAKEEGILYPLADGVLSGSAAALLKRMRAI